MEKCKEMAETAAMEAAEDGVGRQYKAITETGVKRNYSYCDGDVRCSTSLVQRRICEIFIGKTENTKGNETFGLDEPCRSCCSCHGSTVIDKEASEISDLEEDIGDISASTYSLNSCRERTETIPLNDAMVESLDLKVTSELPSDENSGSLSMTEELENSFLVAENDLPRHDVNPSRRSKKAKIPSNAELEDFFSISENNLMQQFTHKYNFDFKKEEPFEGRYEWVQVHLSHNEHLV